MAEGRENGGGETINIFQWNICKATEFIEKVKTEQRMLSPVFIAKSIDNPLSSWRLRVFFNQKEKQLYTSLVFMAELNACNPVVTARCQLVLKKGRKDWQTIIEAVDCKSDRNHYRLPPDIKSFLDEKDVLRLKINLWIKNGPTKQDVPKSKNLYQLHADFRDLLNSAEFADASIVTKDTTLMASKSILDESHKTVTIVEFSGRTIKNITQFVSFANDKSEATDYLALMKKVDKCKEEDLKTALGNCSEDSSGTGDGMITIYSV